QNHTCRAQRLRYLRPRSLKRRPTTCLPEDSSGSLDAATQESLTCALLQSLRGTRIERIPFCSSDNSPRTESSILLLRKTTDQKRSSRNKGEVASVIVRLGMHSRLLADTSAMFDRSELRKGTPGLPLVAVVTFNHSGSQEQQENRARLRP